MNGIFTTIKVINGVPLFLEKHAERLSSIKYTQLLIKKFIKENHITDAALKVNVLESGKITFKVRNLPESGRLVNAVSIISSTPLPIIKQIDRQIYEQAQKYATKKGAERAIFISNNNFLLESTISNIISLDENGEMITPPLTNQGYKGVTRQILLEGKCIKEKEIPADTNRPLVFINSLRIEGITHLDGRKLEDPKELMENIEEIISSSRI